MSEGNEFDKQEFFSLFFNPDVPFNLKFGFLASVGLYTLSPIDLIPEALTGVFGLADDFGIIIIAAQLFTKLANDQLQRLHNARQEQAAPPPPAQQGIYSAHAAPAQPTQGNPNAPEVIRRHQQTQQQIAPPPKPQQLPPRAGDYLQDEAHEQFINQKRQSTDDEFDQLVHGKGQDQQSGGWDYSRNDPFSKPKKK